ncbi:MAG: TonB-dependent receptor [Bacteroidales bacterium]|nr:TonB-dependent receptor [Bacteroidales bacterium]
MKKKIIILITALLFIFTGLYAQKGTVRGQVIDESTGETLVGATVIIVGSNPVIATVTDYDGKFSLENVPSGLQKIQINFISYQEKIIENFEIIANDISILNTMLSPIIQNISQVVVSAKAVKNTDVGLLTLQKKSVTLVNGVSAQAFSKMGDADAASAIKRVTGVSVEGGKYVFVRGLSDRYSKITLNGAEIPGLDPNKNTVQLDIFSTNIIENIVVQKTFSPDLPASFAGGYINISTKSFPEKFTLLLSTSFGYNPNANLRNDFLTYNGGKLDWLGIDDGIREIPEIATNGVPFLYENNDLLDQISMSFNKIMTPITKKSFLNQSYSFSIGNQTKLFSNPLGFIFDMSYSKNFKFYNDGRFSRYNLVEDIAASQGVMNPLLNENEIFSEEEITTSALVGVSYKFTPFHKIGINLMHNGGGLISARQRQGSKPEDNMYMFENTLGFQQRAFNSAQLNGNHAFTNKAEINWTSSLTKSILKEPDLRFFNYDSVSGGNYEISYSAYPSPARFFRNLEEINLDNKIHFTLPYDNFKIKFGASYTFKKRSSISNKYDILSQGLNFNGNVNDYIADENIGQNANDATYGVYYQIDPITDKYNSYIAKEHLFGVYAIAEFKIGNNINVQTGLRYEYDYIFVENMVESYHPKYVRAESVYDKDILPAINVNYSLTKSSNFRIAYSRTLGRPAFREIAPYAYYDFKEGWRVVGNPNLERSIIDNFDLRLEKFFSGNQLVSVSSFAKYFTKPIELVDDPRANNPELHYVNADNSVLYGLEFEIRKNFDFINLEDLLIGGNFTIIKSQVEYVEDFGSTNPYTISRPMYGQSPWVVNMFINYQNDDLGVASNIGFNIDGPKLAVVTKGSTPDVYQQSVPALNFNLSKKIGKNIVAKFSVGNILDADYKKTYTYDNKEYIFQQYSLGRTYSFSLKYLIN